MFSFRQSLSLPLPRVIKDDVLPLNRVIMPDFANLFLLNATNFLNFRDNLMINPIFELLSSRAIQNIPNMIGYL